ncbi:MAG TPA: hypothetical protein ENN19_07230 [Chloroflexi bacterium]|nr:hypothetical protein [Chloroflexota bacterium]
MDCMTRDESSMTALEIAIIFIAFVVVAAVFAFTILQAGAFSDAQGREATYGNPENAYSSMALLESIYVQNSGI